MAFIPGWARGTQRDPVALLPGWAGEQRGRPCDFFYLDGQGDKEGDHVAFIPGWVGGTKRETTCLLYLDGPAVRVEEVGRQHRVVTGAALDHRVVEAPAASK